MYIDNKCIIINSIAEILVANKNNNLCLLDKLADFILATWVSLHYKI